MRPNAGTKNIVGKRYRFDTNVKVFLRLYFHRFMNVVDTRTNENANGSHLLLILPSLAWFRTSDLECLWNRRVVSWNTRRILIQVKPACWFLVAGLPLNKENGRSINVRHQLLQLKIRERISSSPCTILRKRHATFPLFELWHEKSDSFDSIATSSADLRMPTLWE